MKSTELHRTLRPALAAWARARGFRRVSSAPPAFVLELAPNASLSFWVQLASGGHDALMGGSFTLNLKLGDDIGRHDRFTLRLPGTWSPALTARALTLDASVRAKRHRPRGPHPYASFATPEQIEARYYAPLQQLPIDYWMPYVDADDVVAWSSVVVDALDDGMRRVIAEGRAAGLLVPTSGPRPPEVARGRRGSAQLGRRRVERRCTER